MKLVKVRLSCDTSIIDKHLQAFLYHLNNVYGKPVEVSKPYKNRPPNDDISRVYITFAIDER